MTDVVRKLSPPLMQRLSARLATLRLLNLIFQHGFSHNKLHVAFFWLLKAVIYDVFTLAARKQSVDHTLSWQPIFVLGFYRSGTTALQKHLAEAGNVPYLTYFQSLFPECPLRLRGPIQRVLQRITAWIKLQDQIHRKNFAWSDPAEEDVALMSSFSPHTFGWAQVFGRKYEDFLSSSTEGWTQDYLQLLVKVFGSSSGQRLILKSPPNMTRIPQLLNLFPQACFVYISRNEADVRRSNLHLCQAMARTALHDLSSKECDAYIRGSMRFFERQYQTHKTLIHPDRLLEIRFEDFIANPHGLSHNLVAKFWQSDKSAPGSL